MGRMLSCLTRDLVMDEVKAIVGLRPSFSAHVRPTASRGGWGERGAPVPFPPTLLRSNLLKGASA